MESVIYILVLVGTMFYSSAEEAISGIKQSRNQKKIRGNFETELKDKQPTLLERYMRLLNCRLQRQLCIPLTSVIRD